MKEVFAIDTLWQCEVVCRPVQKETPQMYIFGDNKHPRRARKSDCFDTEIEATQEAIKILTGKVEGAKRKLNDERSLLGQAKTRLRDLVRAA